MVEVYPSDATISYFLKTLNNYEPGIISLIKKFVQPRYNFEKNDVISILIVDLLDKNKIVPKLVTISKVYCDQQFNVYYEYYYFNEKILFYETYQESKLVIL